MSGRTSVIRKHLKNKHRIDIQSSNEIRINSYQQGITESFARAQEGGERYKRRRLDSGKGEGLLDPDVLEDLYLRWITAANIPFEMAGHTELQRTFPLSICS